MSGGGKNVGICHHLLLCLGEKFKPLVTLLQRDAYLSLNAETSAKASLISEQKVYRLYMFLSFVADASQGWGLCLFHSPVNLSGDPGPVQDRLNIHSLSIGRMVAQRRPHRTRHERT